MDRGGDGGAAAYMGAGSCCETNAGSSDAGGAIGVRCIGAGDVDAGGNDGADEYEGAEYAGADEYPDEGGGAGCATGVSMLKPAVANAAADGDRGFG